MGYDLVTMRECGQLTGVGRPALPSREIRVALPAGMLATGVRVEFTASEQVLGSYSILPAQPPRHVRDRVTRADFVGPDAELNSSGLPYPAELVELVHQTDLAGQGMALVRLYPLHYVPAEKKLTLCTSVDLLLKGVGGYECGDYLPERISAPGRRAMSAWSQAWWSTPATWS